MSEPEITNVTTQLLLALHNYPTKFLIWHLAYKPDAPFHSLYLLMQVVAKMLENSYTKWYNIFLCRIAFQSVKELCAYENGRSSSFSQKSHH
jgi:hypothetical protein